MLDGSRAVAVGELGVVVRTSNGGKSWTQQRVSGVDVLADVVVAEGDTLFAVGSPGAIFRSDDAGATWIRQQSRNADGLRLNRVAFVDVNHGWVVGQAGIILHTEDGGESWVRQRLPLDFEMNAVVFVDENNGMASGNAFFSGGFIARTTDGGATWQTAVRTDQHSSAVVWAGFDANRWIAQEGAALLHTEDGGITWRRTFPPDRIVDLRFADAMRGMLVGAERAFLTEDGGETWSPIASPPGRTSRISFANREIATLIGLEPSIVRTDDAGSTWRVQSAGFSNILYGVSMLSSNTAIIVGLDGFIARTDDGGASWTRQQSGSDQSVYGVWFLDQLRGFAVRNGPDTMLRTTDGGLTWTPQNVLAGDLRAVSFSDDQHGFAVGTAVFRTDDGGDTWTRQAVSARGEFFAVHLLDANRATMVGEYGKIYQTTDGGATWVQRDSGGTTQWLTGVWFGDASTGIAVGYDRAGERLHGLILRTVDGGETWTQQPSGLTAPLKSVQFVSAEVGTIVGAGVVLRTVDGGATWSFQEPGPNNLFAVSLLDESVGMAVGTGGAVLTTTTGGDGYR